MKNLKEKTLNTVVRYIVNTIDARELYKEGGWSNVEEIYTEKEYFNPHFAISATAICVKLRENNEKINMPIQSNMGMIEDAVNKTLNRNVVKYYVNRKIHALKIIA